DESMDRDSEVETVLADEEWLDTSRENVYRRRSRRPNPASSARQLIEEFDEEELFSTSGSLSSLHEFSDNDDSSSSSNDDDGVDARSNGADSNNSAHSSASSVNGRSHNGSIIRNGASGLYKDNLGINAGGHAVDATVSSSAAHTESEIDVDGDDGRGFRTLAAALKKEKKKKAAGSAAVGSSPYSSPSAWQSHRVRKVIADDDDEDKDDHEDDNGDGYDDEGKSDNENDDDADTEDIPGIKQRRKKSRLERGIMRRHSSGMSARHSSSSSNSRAIEQQQGTRSAIDKSSSINDLAGIEHRRRHSEKRRKPRYEDPDYADSSGCPQLVYFASKGDSGSCRKLLLRGATIDSTDSHGWTALHQACRHKHIDVLELLLNPPTRARLHFDADVDAETSSDRSNASDPADSRLVRQLRSPFPNVNKPTLQSRLTPLHQAVISDDIQIVRLLLDNGAITSLVNSRQLTPLDTCSNERIARLLTDRAKMQRTILSRDKAGQTKLHRACNSGDLELVNDLINQGADINMKDNAGWTPLHEAALEGHNSVVVALLRHGADFAAKGFGGDTPLHDACANGHYDVVRSLLTVGADPHLKNSKGVTPEGMAREEDQEEVAQLIEQYCRDGLKELLSSNLLSKTAASMQTKADDNNNSKGKERWSAILARQSSIKPESTLKPESSGVGRSVSSESVGLAESDFVSSDHSAFRSKQSTRKGKAAVIAGSALKERRSNSSQSQRQRPDSPVGSSAAMSSQKRELVALRRLREEAEKPLVNYYFSSNSSKLSRDERKLQKLMGTFERLERQRKPKERLHPMSPEKTNDDSVEHIEPSVIVHDADGQENTRSPNFSADNGNNRADRSASEGDRPGSALQPGSISPSRQRGSVSKKRLINEDEDKDDEGNKDSKEAIDSVHLMKQGSRKAGSKRAKHFANNIGGRVIEEDAKDASGRRSEAPSEGAGSKRKSLSSMDSANAEEISSTFVRSLTPTVEIKSEYPVLAYAPSGSRSQRPHQEDQGNEGIAAARRFTSVKAGSAAIRSQSSSSLKENRPSKHRLAGGLTIDETLSSAGSGSKVTRSLTPASIAAQAIRYLPLYTIQLRCDPPTSKLDYFVVDLQIRLLLGMSVETPSETKARDANDKDNAENGDDDDDNDNDDEKSDINPLFEAYPHLCRQRITEVQKEHLWKPLAGMFVSNMQFIHGAASSSPHDDALSCAGHNNDADKDLVDQFTLHEKKRFVALSLYFVKLDEVVELIRKDYPQISQHGLPSISDFVVEKVSAPTKDQLKEGQVIVSPLYMSVDPYQRGRLSGTKDSYVDSYEKGEPITNFLVAKVIASANKDYKEGDLVLADNGKWQTQYIADGSEIEKAPAREGISPKDYLGVLSMPAFTAYYGTIILGKPKAGETILVSSASGAVGQMVVQIAKAKGLRVVAVAGSDEKIEHVKQLGADVAFNYKKCGDYSSAIKKAAPNGIDIYFDNVGGEFLDAAIANTRNNARIVICGQISEYNLSSPSEIHGIKSMRYILSRRVTMTGFIILDHLHSSEHEKFYDEVSKLYKEGKIKYSFHETSGFENAPQALLDLFSGKNVGKGIVKV
ncbi:hypothetical protein J3B02_002546, partial [Coemansia erecta]